MAKGGPVAEDEEKRIIEALESGKTTRQVAEEVQRSKGTITNVAARNNLDLVGRAQNKKANLIRSCYDSAARIELIGELLNKAKELMKTCNSSRDLQYLATAIAIGIDKRRLEESTDSSARGGEIRILFEKMGEEVET
ncbi:MAG: hypothetical protein WBK88_00330 [Methanothrix sp.]|jgi:IS30 family transposase